MTSTIGERDMQGSVTALKAAPKLHSYNSSRNINSDTQKYTYIMHFKKTYTYTHICLICLFFWRSLLELLVQDFLYRPIALAVTLPTMSKP